MSDRVTSGMGSAVIKREIPGHDVFIRFYLIDDIGYLRSLMEMVGSRCFIKGVGDGKMWSC